MSEIKMKACPFCESSLLRIVENSIGEKIVTCLVCDCDGPAAKTENTFAEAVKLWNTRVAKT